MKTRGVKTRVRSLFYLHYSFRILPLFLVLMLLVDLLRSHESALEWHTQTSSNADFCLSQNPWAGISKRASGALLVPWFNISPVTSWRACSTSTLLQTILSISASKSCSSLWRWIINPPRWHKLNWTPHAQITGVSVIIILILQAIIITKITNSNNNNNNYWMRLSIIWRIMKIEVSVIRRSRNNNNNNNNNKNNK